MHASLQDRLAGIRGGLLAEHRAGASMSSATKGHERRAVVRQLLEACFPPPFRFGTGDCIDWRGNTTGELDVVVEYPFLPSLTVSGHSRLYLADGVAAIVEVKSDLAAQWSEAEESAQRVKVLRRQLSALAQIQGLVFEWLPYFVVAYSGWSTIAPLKAKIEGGAVDGALVLDSGLFYSSIEYPAGSRREAVGDPAMWAFIATLHVVISGLKAMHLDLMGYATAPA